MRIATFNVENLFSRPVVLNMQDNDEAARILDKIREFTGLMNLKSYAGRKARILKLYNEIDQYIFINIRSSRVG